ncbi:spermidine/putrescine ABC transporter substrate-binding protein [Mycobacterium sp. TNTM28]|uniref:Spermidine/putrescine ABC transporter substrate-binding protein n=1 Tax=[Mycobacterium] fortunisiensis TaxID=2600579 RepID=A0ABS6KNC4_9MYCO|nr:spermidine/putrescine ABC transporter substrate-binding protein [[Mycobacterium] fortunisiensis]MBU9765085.1 spermidine/putrescine ABC transporter substrate-binding protein [[Mycobacterium] fortunisiensis]
MPENTDPFAHLATNRTSRRRFLGRSAAAAAALALGPAVLAACGSDEKSSAPSTSAEPDDGSPASGLLRVSNWPLYMAPGFIDAFQKTSGLQVDYKEDFNDNEQWFAKFKEPLSRKQDIGADLVVPTEFMAARILDLHWLNEIRDARVPNKKNLRPDLLNSTIDPGRKYIAPFMSGMVGLAYNKAATGRPITKTEDLWDPAFKGRVSLLSDLQDGLGMVMLSQGNSPENPTTEAVEKAVATIRENKDKGQIRKFTGNDYAEELASGNVVLAQAYSGDAVQLKADNPDIEFIVPDAGGTWFIDTMVIPYTTGNQKAAEAWIDYLYDRANYAKLIATTQFVPVLSHMTDELSKIDPTIAGNQLINPPAAMLDNLKSWAAMTDEQTQEFNGLYAAVTGG